MPEWDRKHLVVYGSSQGGGSALILAGFNKHVTALAANVPALPIACWSQVISDTSHCISNTFPMFFPPGGQSVSSNVLVSSRWSAHPQDSSNTPGSDTSRQSKFHSRSCFSVTIKVTSARSPGARKTFR